MLTEMLMFICHGCAGTVTPMHSLFEFNNAMHVLLGQL